MKIRTHSFQMLMLLIITICDLLFGCCDGADFNSSCIENERDALTKFKAGLSDPSGRLSSWVGYDCCTWNGVVCDETRGHVVELHFRNPHSEDSLEGEIDHSIINLTHLTHLDLSNNHFRGEVPHNLGNLSHLLYLNLSYNSFSMPENLHFASSLSSLKYMDLSGLNLSQCNDWLNSINMLPSLVQLCLSTCQLPDTNPEFVHANYTSLEFLDLSDNHFYNFSNLHWLFNISTLHHLDLSHNLFKESIPMQMGVYDLLEFLDLSFNSFEGEIPVTLRNLSNLYYLDLSGNKFNSTLPFWLFDSRTIRHLYLRASSFEGSVPSEISNSSLIVTLDLSFNNLTREIPKTFTNLCNLQELYLEGNNMSGSISGLLGNSSGCIRNSLKTLNLRNNKLGGCFPEQLGLFQNLEQLDLSGNYFEGSIPNSIGQLSKLEALDFSFNSLEGKFSEHHLLNIERLKILRLEGNSLIFNVGSTYFPPFQVQEIGLSSCKVGPGFPRWLRTQKNISVLLMSNASISDGIPQWFESSTSTLIELDLSHNNIRGTLPVIRALRYDHVPYWRRTVKLDSNKFEGPLTNFPSDIRELHLSNNFIQRNIPLSFCNLIGLEVLDLSSNRLFGRLPQCLRKLQNLRVLDLGHNNLSGHIPKALGSLESLLSLHLQNNSLEGKIPKSLKKLNQLICLDLSMNALVGSIPPWISEISTLGTLNLHSNMFHGEIPPQLCKLQSLRILDLANNQMIGKIPACFNDLTAMKANFSVSEYLEEFAQLAYFDHEEKILAYIKGKNLVYTRIVAYLCSIDLSRNNLLGEIPQELMNLTGLNNLNLFRNKLTGNIPSNIGNLKDLESLDLSRNDLSGSIPASISDLNFLSHLNLSFNHFSGRIPSGNQLQTLDDKSIYMGNNGLCGPPLESCKEDEAPKAHEHRDEKEKGDSEMIWFYSGLAAGFVAGFVGLCSLFYWNHSWRSAWFWIIDRIYERISIAVAVKANQLKGKFQKQNYRE